MKKFAFLLILTAIILSPCNASCETSEDIFGFDELLKEINPVAEENGSVAENQSETTEDNDSAKSQEIPTAETDAVNEENNTEMSADNDENNSETPADNAKNEEEPEVEDVKTEEPGNEEDELEKMLNGDLSDEGKSEKDPEDLSDEKNNKTIDNSSAEDTDQPADILKETLLDDETSQKARQDARNLLSQQPIILNLRDSQKKLIQEGDERRKLWQQNNNKIAKKEMPAFEEEPAEDESTSEENEEKKLRELTKNLSSAPFGLYWGASKETLEKLGFEFKQIERKDYKNVYQVINPKQGNKTFDIISAIFGEQNRLWCIFAQSHAMKDQPNASEVLALYRKYYSALKQKYGHDQEFFSPNIYTEDIVEEEETKTGEKKQKKTKKVITSPLGGDNFLKELKDETASLYATFESEDIGVTLAVFVDENSQSSISLDYKNLKIMKQEQDDNFNNLISDL